MQSLKLTLLLLICLFSSFAFAQEENDKQLVPPPPSPEIIEESEQVYTIVEEMPRFSGCEDMDGMNSEKVRCAEKKMLEFLYDNLTYPQAAKENCIEGVVVARFTIEKDGSLSNTKILRALDNDCDEEALRVVNMMPNWIPGKQRNEIVRVEYNLPIRFKDQDNPCSATFMLENDGKKAFTVNTPDGPITISPNSYKPMKLDIGTTLTYTRKSKEFTLLQVTEDMDGKAISIQKVMKKGR